MGRLFGYLVAVGLLLLPTVAMAAASSDEHAAVASSDEYASVLSSDEYAAEDSSDELAVEDTSDATAPKEISVMVGFFAKHVDQSDDPNEDLNMVVVSYDNYVVSRYINTWDDTTYFGGKRFSTNKYAFFSNRNFFFQGSLYAGLLYGYGNNAAINIKGIAPAMFPTIGVGYQNTSLEMAYVPTPSGGVFLSFFRYSF
ncbi:MAG: hypothetical protein LJE87_10640 [Deltaproteobacteria bacterium]|nr:hypothetical protein [Deltaproteobacteria bacterium]